MRCSFILAFIALVPAWGCSRATTLHLRDGTESTVHLVQVPEIQALVAETEGGLTTIDIATVERATLPGTGLRRVGGSMLAIGAAGLSVAVTGQIREGPDERCAWCAVGIPATLIPASVGLALLIQGTVLRTMAERRVALDPRPVGRAHRRLGGALLGAGLLLAPLGLGIASSRNATEGALIGGAFAFVIGAPLVFFGIGYLVRGGRLLREGESRGLMLDADGIRFDFSL